MYVPFFMLTLTIQRKSSECECENFESQSCFMKFVADVENGRTCTVRSSKSSPPPRLPYTGAGYSKAYSTFNLYSKHWVQIIYKESKFSSKSRMKLPQIFKFVREEMSLFLITPFSCFPMLIFCILVFF